jgi:hypothetical protein
MKYKTEKEINDLVSRFENGTIRREEWKHAEHLVVALYYICNSPGLSDAYLKMRNNLMNHLKTIGIDFSKEMPYHETITLFWMRMVLKFRESKNGCSIAEMTDELLEKFCDKDLPLKYYSRELLFSDRARAEFVEPDLREF